MGDLGAGNHGLGWRTPGVHAGAAKMLLFNQGHGPALIGKLLRQRIAGLSGTDHDSIVPRHDATLLRLGDRSVVARDCRPRELAELAILRPLPVSDGQVGLPGTISCVSTISFCASRTWTPRTNEMVWLGTCLQTPESFKHVANIMQRGVHRFFDGGLRLGRCAGRHCGHCLVTTMHDQVVPEYVRR